MLEAPAGAHPGGSGVLDEVVRPQLVQHPGQHVRQVAVALKVVDEQLKDAVVIRAGHELKFWVPGNYMLFFLQGNIAENKFVRLIEKYVIRETTTRQFHRSLPQIYTPKEITKNKKTSQTHCLIGNLTLSLSDKDTTCLTLLNNILGGTGFTSKLNLSVRERNGWVYTIDSSLNLYSDVGVWCIYVRPG